MVEDGLYDTAVLTVGSVQAGTKANIIPDQAEILLNVRSYDPEVRQRVLAAITRIVEGEARVAGAPRPPHIESIETAPAVVNDADGATRTPRIGGGRRTRSADRDVREIRESAPA